jgi:RNA polymerase sigma-70 factor (ECF subfamily)
VIDRESSAALGQALAQLSPKLRTAVVLRYVAGLAYADVARAMKCGEITARTRVARGLSDLGRRLARRQKES